MADNNEIEIEETEPALSIAQIRNDWTTKFGRQKVGLSIRRDKFDGALHVWAEQQMPENEDLDWADQKADLNRQIDALEAERREGRAAFEEKTDEIRRLNDLVGEQQDQIANLEEQVTNPRIAALRIARNVIVSSVKAGPFSSQPAVPASELISVADWILQHDEPTTWAGVLRKNLGDLDDGTHGEMLTIDDLGGGSFVGDSRPDDPADEPGKP